MCVLLTNLYEVIYKNHYQTAEKIKQNIEFSRHKKRMKVDLELYLKNDNNDLLKIKKKVKKQSRTVDSHLLWRIAQRS